MRKKKRHKENTVAHCVVASMGKVEVGWSLGNFDKIQRWVYLPINKRIIEIISDDVTEMASSV